MTEGYEQNEMGLGRQTGREKAPEELVTFENATEAREAFLSDSEYTGRTFDAFVAHTLIEDGALRIVAKNLHRFPAEDHSEIIESLSESEEGREALGL